MITSINIISHEQKIRVRYISADPEDLEQISELAVNITTDGKWSANCLYIAFLWQYLLRLPCRKDQKTYFVTKCFNLWFGEQLEFEGPLDPLIQFLNGDFHVEQVIQKKNDNKQVDNNTHLSSPFIPFSQ